ASGNTSEFSASVDASLTPSGLSLAATEQAAFSGVLATFTDADPTATAASFRATVDWGDGTTSSGTIGTGPAGFTVSGTHTYAEEGNQAVTVTITDVPGNVQVTASSAVAVADAPLALGNPAVAAAEGTPFSGVVATLTDGDANATAGDYT